MVHLGTSCRSRRARAREDVWHADRLAVRFEVIGSRFEAGMDEVTLRDYRPGDAAEMYALDIVCFEPVFRFSRGAMRGFAEASGAIAVLAEAAGELVGFCVVQMEGKIGYVVTLDVAAAWR